MTRDPFDQAVKAVRDEEVADETVEAARGRVWQALSAEVRAPAAAPAEANGGDEGPIRGCADVRALFPRYRNHALGEARELLVQDHLRGCAECRRVLAGRTARILSWRQPDVGRRTSPITRWAVAASLVVVAGGLTFLFRGAFTTAPAGPRATLESADGAVYLIGDEAQHRVERGAEMHERQWLRTPRGTRAVVRLRDDSRVEMREHTELSVSMNRKDLTVHLERGSILVRAAKRREGHLQVVTDDATVSVTGTVFSVNRGLKGTRISVLEGSVWVRPDGERDDQALTAGQQLTTSRRIQAVPIREEIAWSPALEQHAALLADVSAQGGKLETVQMPGLRYQSRLLDTIPAGAVVFAALPNFGATLGQVHALFQERLQGSPALQKWWRESGGNELGGANLPRLVRELQALSEHIGDEVVVALAPAGEKGDDLRPLIVAQVRRPGLRQVLEGKLAAAGAAEGVRIVDERGLAAETPGVLRDGALVLVTDTLVAVGPDAGALRAALARGSRFAATTFGRRVADAYRDGVGVLFAADLEAIARRAAADTTDVDAPGLLRELGADNARYLVVEQETSGDTTQNRAAVSFAGPRQGVASWLAAPAPMGSLDFVTDRASFAAAFVVKEPTAVLDDLVRVATVISARAPEELRAFEQRLGLELRAEIAAPLGNDVAVAIDGPLLPVPSWKLVVEVHQPDRLVAALEKLAAEVNRQLAAQPRAPGEPPRELRLERRRSRGRDTFALTLPGAPTAFHWMFVDGYMIAGPSEDLLHRAVRARQNGRYLRNTERFWSLIPSDRHPNFSAVVYHDLGQAGAVVGDILSGTTVLGTEERAALEQITAGARPGMVCVYGEESEIQVASAGGFFGLGLDHVVGSAGLADLLRRQQGK
jgi:hypothetical protein